nr:MAG TPA: hypothetical protein [Caudoviricetes sp.]
MLKADFVLYKNESFVFQAVIRLRDFTSPVSA